MTQHPANHLAGQTSPYLLQHLHNPVDWYPWGEEALQRARSEKRPIFLSVGYSACHWCHVMEHESFEDPATAEILNTHFVSIKVDREERPDLDEIYMSAVQLLTGSGGWPMSVFLTPELEPFFAGTYFPNEARYGMASFREVLNRIAQLWKEDPDRLRSNAAELTQALRREMSRATAVDRVELEPGLLRLAENQLRGSFDPEWGGFGGAPKFPPSGALGLLMRREAAAPDPERRNMIDVTLSRMARGGMYDQVGGGFARYSVDEQWLVPHFEKMLYDNALLARCYTDAWQLTRRPLYRRIAVQTLDYLLRDMQDDAGGWHSAEDADSEGREGLFYLWGPDKIDALLGPEDGALIREFYGLSEEGNFEGANILHLPQSPEAFAQAKGLDEQALWEKIDPLRERLFQAREQRTRPGRDDKLLTAWNGMAIAALARAGRVFDEPRFIEAAQRAAEFFWNDMRRNGVLLRSYRQGKAQLPGYLDDYAELALGLLELYQAEFQPQWLQRAGHLIDEAGQRFRDPETGLFFFTAEDHPHLLLRSHSSFDGATPSGNAAIAQALLQYGWLAEDQPALERAEALLRALSGLLRQAPRAFLNSLWALDLYLDPPWRLAIVAPGGAQAARPLLQAIDERYRPNCLRALHDPDTPQAPPPGFDKLEAVEGRPTVYPCRRFQCQAPVHEPQDLRKILDATPSGQA